MFRRWLIRCLFMLPLTLCALGWVWSESHGVAVTYAYQDATHYVRGGSSSGRVFLLWGRADTWVFYPSGLSYASWSPGPGEDLLRPGEMGWLGFGLSRLEGSLYTDRTVAVPYWFLLLLSALLLIPAWRTTRPRPHPQGFPVELATRKEPP